MKNLADLKIRALLGLSAIFVLATMLFVIIFCYVFFGFLGASVGFVSALIIFTYLLKYLLQKILNHYNVCFVRR